MVKTTRYNIAIVLLVCLGSYTYGFSFAVFGTSIGEPGFYVYFALDRKSRWSLCIKHMADHLPFLQRKVHILHLSLGLSPLFSVRELR